MFSENDLKLIKERGISEAQIAQQIEQFKQGFPKMNIIKPALYRDGIKQLTDKQHIEYIKIYEKASRRLKRVKFVPASGAATRMFGSLYEIMHHYKGTEEEYLKISSDRSFNSLYYMLQNLHSFAFFDDLIAAIEKNASTYTDIQKKHDYPFLLRCLLESEGLNYGNMPKGLLKFHRTAQGERTPVHEHLLEGIRYAASGKKIHIHFTVSPDHLELFKAHLEEIVPTIQKTHKVKFTIAFSIQKPSTDTIAVDIDNVPVRDQEGNLVFRPGGHGALIYNLNELDADIIFIKNIDNVVQERMQENTIFFKKVLAGVLLSVQQKAASLFKKINKKPTPELLAEAEEFLRKKLFVIPPDAFEKWNLSAKTAYLTGKLNRPIRVCGMVKNEGEPGGGPFWVRAKDNSLSLQIVEGSQFADDQKEIMQKSTHFNPVDIVCSTKDLKGKPHNLLDFVDTHTGFISSKQFNGNDIKALELPGLWNGAMAHWNTLFVEVPASTFNPVKTLSDLLRTEHLYDKDLLKKSSDDSLLVE